MAEYLVHVGLGRAGAAEIVYLCGAAWTPGDSWINRADARPGDPKINCAECAGKLVGADPRAAYAAAQKADSWSPDFGGVRDVEPVPADFDRKPMPLPLKVETPCGGCGTCANCQHNGRLAAEKEVGYLREQLAANDLDLKAARSDVSLLRAAEQYAAEKKRAAEDAMRLAEERARNLHETVCREQGKVDALEKMIDVLLERLLKARPRGVEGGR